MKILFINNNDCGFADHIEVAAGMTVGSTNAGAAPQREAAELPDPRQSPAGSGRLRAAGRGPS